MSESNKVGYVVKATVSETKAGANGEDKVISKTKVVSGVMVTRSGAEEYCRMYKEAHPESEAYIAGTND